MTGIFKKEVRFPDKGETNDVLTRRLESVKKALVNRKIDYNLGLLYTPPDQKALETYRYFLDQNPNHLGDWFTKESHPYATEELEQDVLQKLACLYGGTSKNLAGYITSGGTEGNLYSAWLGRKNLEEHVDRGEVCLLGTDLTHYSVPKISDITGVAYAHVPLSRATWSMDPQGLREKIYTLYDEGYRGFMLVITDGYTSTGTRDATDALLTVMDDVRKKLKDIRTYVWIDAALNGLITPFVAEKQPAYFSVSEIQAVVVDFHKLGGVPYPASAVLYRSSLRKLVERDIDYLQQNDSSILGSRPGAPAAAMWAVMHARGKDGFTKLIEEQLVHKNVFIREIQRILPDAELITDPHSLTCGIIFHSLPAQRLPKEIEQKYWLHAKENTYTFYKESPAPLRLYKFYFLPHVKRAIVEAFVHDLELL